MAESSTTARKVWATPAELVEWLQLGEGGLKRLQRMRATGEGPEWLKLGREVRYAWVDVHRWCREQQHEANRG